MQVDGDLACGAGLVGGCVGPHRDDRYRRETLEHEAREHEPMRGQAGPGERPRGEPGHVFGEQFVEILVVVDRFLQAHGRPALEPHLVDGTLPLGEIRAAGLRHVAVFLAVELRVAHDPVGRDRQLAGLAHDQVEMDRRERAGGGKPPRRIEDVRRRAGRELQGDGLGED